MDGYRDDPKLTAKAFEDGWLHTGDVAVRDPDGFLRIVGRVKDKIVSGAYEVYPQPIEAIIGEDPAVFGVAVIGVPHPEWVEAVKALVVVRPGYAVPDREKLKAAVVERLREFDKPRYIQFIDSIPLTRDKVDKKELRAKYGQPSD